MAGTLAPGELSRASATRFAVATAADDPAIRRLLRENPMEGDVSVAFAREPNYFHGADLAGGSDQTIVAFDGTRLVCMGRCARRDCWVNGEVRRAGYLAELRLDGSARGRFGILRDGYRVFDSVQGEDPADLHFTSIAAGNERARRLLEAGVRGLPAYGFLAELDTLLVAVPRRAAAGKLSVEPAQSAHVADMVRVLNGHGQLYQCAAVWTEERLVALARNGLPLERFLVALEGGKMVACGALWDQRSFRQTVICGYAPALTLARPLLTLVSRFFGTTSLPRVGSVLRHAFLSPLAFARGAEALLPEFTEAAFTHATRAGVESLTIALPATDPRLAEMRRCFSTRTWRSRLYRVDWPGRPRVELHHRGAGFLPEVALL